MSVTARNIVVLDWYDRSPDTWVCNLNALDLTDPTDAAYYELINKALLEPTKSVQVPDDSVLVDGDSEETRSRAEIEPPCSIIDIVTLYYE